MYGEERGEKSFSLMHLYMMTVCMTQYKTFKQLTGPLLTYVWVEMSGIVTQGSF